MLCQFAHLPGDRRIPHPGFPQGGIKSVKYTGVDQLRQPLKHTFRPLGELPDQDCGVEADHLDAMVHIIRYDTRHISLW